MTKEKIIIKLKGREEGREENEENERKHSQKIAFARSSAGKTRDISNLQLPGGRLPLHSSKTPEFHQVDIIKRQRFLHRQGNKEVAGEIKIT